MSEQEPHVVILGSMGVGKTTSGVAVAKRLGRPYLDSDDDVERLTGGSGGEFARTNGVAALHELEAAVLLGALAHPEPCVISAAASVVENTIVRSVIKRRAIVVRLVADTSTVLQRQSTGGHRRPMDLADLEALAERREPFFASLEDLRVSSEAEVDAVVGEIVGYLSRS